MSSDRTFRVMGNGLLVVLAPMYVTLLVFLVASCINTFTLSYVPSPFSLPNPELTQYSPQFQSLAPLPPTTPSCPQLSSHFLLPRPQKPSRDF